MTRSKVIFDILKYYLTGNNEYFGDFFRPKATKFSQKYPFVIISKNETSLVAICFDRLNFAKYNNKALG